MLPAIRSLSYSLLVCLLDTPFDRCPAGFTYLLTGLLLCGRWQICSHRGKRCQRAEADVSDDAHVRFLSDESFGIRRRVVRGDPRNTVTGQAPISLAGAIEIVLRNGTGSLLDQAAIRQLRSACSLAFAAFAESRLTHYAISAAFHHASVMGERPVWLTAVRRKVCDKRRQTV